MMLVLSLLIVATLVPSFYRVDEVTGGMTQALPGAGVVYALAWLLLGWVV